MDTLKIMTRLYRKLGMTTEQNLLEARAKCVDEIVDKLKLSDVFELVRCALGLRLSERPAFLDLLCNADPGLELSHEDKELSILACAIVGIALHTRAKIAAHLSLTFVAACFGGLRPCELDPDLLDLASQTLASLQAPEKSVPKTRTYAKQPADLVSATQEFSTVKTDYGQANQHIAMSLSECAKYVESTALAAARSDNELLEYIKRLEEEARVQWWVMGGWSDGAEKPFRELDKIEAALRVAVELEEKHSSPVGLFAAPALFDLIVSKERAKDEVDSAEIGSIATKLSMKWREEQFKEFSNGPHRSLLPISAAMGIAAIDEDADDWKARFQRITRINASETISTRQLSLQFYRELLILREL